MLPELPDVASMSREEDPGEPQPCEVAHEGAQHAPSTATAGGDDGESDGARWGLISAGVSGGKSLTLGGFACC